MKNVVKITESDLRSIIRETLNEALSETSRRQKAQSAILGKNRKIKTLAIISAENPMGEKADKEYNKNATNELIKNLSIGHYRYFQTKGLYETPENSIIVYNISLDDTLFLCYKYNQESVIFIDMRGDEISYQYWEGDDHTSKLKLQHEEHEVVDATNDKDYWTQICKKFKFRIPFFEDITKYNKELVDCSKSHDVDTLINECLNDNKTGYSKYSHRGKLKCFLRELNK